MPLWLIIVAVLLTIFFIRLDYLADKRKEIPQGLEVYLERAKKRADKICEEVLSASTKDELCSSFSRLKEELRVLLQPVENFNHGNIQSLRRTVRMHLFTVIAKHCKTGLARQFSERDITDCASTFFTEDWVRGNVN